VRNVREDNAAARNGGPDGGDVETLRGVYEAFNRRDIDALLEGFTPEVEIEETADVGYAALLLRVLGPRFVILSGRYHGLEEVRRLFESVWEIAEWFEVEPQEFRAVGERMIVPLAMKAKARETGIEGDALTVHVWTMRDGKGFRLQVFATMDEALTAARA
jgi:ketosteroid isomerase-like protein